MKDFLVVMLASVFSMLMIFIGAHALEMLVGRFGVECGIWMCVGGLLFFVFWAMAGDDIQDWIARHRRRRQ